MLASSIWLPSKFNSSSFLRPRRPATFLILLRSRLSDVRIGKLKFDVSVTLLWDRTSDWSYLRSLRCCTSTIRLLDKLSSFKLVILLSTALPEIRVVIFWPPSGRLSIFEYSEVMACLKTISSLISYHITTDYFSKLFEYLQLPHGRFHNCLRTHYHRAFSTWEPDPKKLWNRAYLGSSRYRRC